MKKVICVLVGLVLMGGVGFGYTTWREAFDSGETKYNAHNYINARADFVEALNLTIVEAEKLDTQRYIGYSYYSEKNYSQARIEFIKVLEMAGVHPYSDSYAQLYIGHTYYEEKNYAQARIEYIKVMGIAEGYFKNKSDAWNRIVEIGGDFTSVITALTNTKDWQDYFYRAKVKEQSKDWQGAYNDLDEAWRLRPDDNTVLEMLIKEIKEVELRLK